MFLHINTLTPDLPRTVKITDWCALALASVASATSGSRSFDAEAAVLTMALSAAGWFLGSRILVRYEGAQRQGMGSELTRVSVLALTVTAGIALLRTAVPRYAVDISVHRFFAVLWPGTIVPRVAMPGAGALAGGEQEDVLIIGTGPLGRHTACQLRDRKGLRGAFYFLSFPGDASGAHLPGPLLGGSEHLERVLAERVLQEVYIAGNSLRHGRAMQAAIRVCERLGVPFALPASHFRFDRARPADARAFADGYVHYLTVEHKPLQMAAKRVLDIVGSIAALLLLSPLLVVVALLVALTSPGPILFRQPRVGRYGRPFDMLKFRSMVVNAEALKAGLGPRNEQSGPVFKIRNDPRVTRVGRVLRKYSIDEIPQFVNVLRGEMSIVGPRPPVPSEVEKYHAWQRRRLSVRPGITCVWQVSGRNRIPFEEWMYLDLSYIDHWNLAKDLQLMLKTVPVVVTGRDAS
jgi:exopolysaccharide biosynthesis polyprenyl glycosylphosphotransferase